MIDKFSLTVLGAGILGCALGGLYVNHSWEADVARMRAQQAHALAQKEAEYRALEQTLSEKANEAWAKEAQARAELARIKSDNSYLVIRVRELADRSTRAAIQASGPGASAEKAKAESDALAAEGAELLVEITTALGDLAVEHDALIDLQ